MDKVDLLKKFVDGTDLSHEEFKYLQFFGLVHQKTPNWWQLTAYGRELLSPKAP